MYAMTANDIAFGALIISAFSFLLSYRGYLISKNSNLIAQKDHNEKYQNIDAYLIDSMKWKSNGIDYISFAVNYTNRSSTSNSFSNLELQIEFFDSDNLLKTAKIEPDFEVLPINSDGSNKKLILPLNFSEKETKSGWVTFKLSKEIWGLYKIDLYRVKAFTASGKSVSFKTHVVNEVIYGKK